MANRSRWEDVKSRRFPAEVPDRLEDAIQVA